jgi:hypothetical protein
MNLGCLKIWLITGYFPKLAGMAAVPTQNKGTCRRGGSKRVVQREYPAYFWNNEAGIGRDFSPGLTGFKLMSGSEMNDIFLGRVWMGI